jgi:hypothetical protein
MAGETPVIAFAVIARSVSDPRVKPEGMRGNRLKCESIMGIAASLPLLAMTIYCRVATAPRNDNLLPRRYLSSQ